MEDGMLTQEQRATMSATWLARWHIVITASMSGASAWRA
jgi:hypothetical protein